MDEESQTAEQQSKTEAGVRAPEAAGAGRLPLYALLAEFKTPEEVLAAARKTYEAGYRRIDAYSPFPIHGLAEAVGFQGGTLPKIVFAGGVFGMLGGFGLQYWVSAIELPVVIAGRPMNSWPAFIPVTFECTILVAAITAVLGMLALNGLPRPHHPIFNAPRFALASRSRFFLAIEARDPQFDREKTRQFLEGLQAREVSEVEL